MTRDRFYARPIRDHESGRWTADTNIEGLFVDAATEEECRDVIAEFAPDLISENHGIEEATLIMPNTGQDRKQAWGSATPA